MTTGHDQWDAMQQWLTEQPNLHAKLARHHLAITADLRELLLECEAERRELRARVAAQETLLRAIGQPAEVMAESLFRHIEHGDEKHREWLRLESLNWARMWNKVDA